MSLKRLHPQSAIRYVMLLMEGTTPLVLIHGNGTYFAAAARAAKRLISKRWIPAI